MTAPVYPEFAFAGHHDEVITIYSDDRTLDSRWETSPLGSAAWAAAEAEMLLTPTSWRWANTRQVAEHAGWASAAIRSEDRDLLVAAASLHDVGSSEAIAETGCPPLDAARQLRNLGLFELACLVAHHTSARVQPTPMGAAAKLATYPRPRGHVADALSYSILTSGPATGTSGAWSTFEEIIQPPESSDPPSHERRANTNAAVARTLRRVSRSRPPGEPLAVTPIVLGCSTLVRLQGILDRKTAEQAARILRAVADQRPHVVVLDLALLTGLDLAGAESLRATEHPAAGPICVTIVDPRARDRGLFERITPPGRTPPIVYGIDAAVAPHCG